MKASTRAALIDPLGLVQGPVEQAGETAHARFARLARPELRGELCSARVSAMRAVGAAARGEQLVTWVEARGSLLLGQQ